MSPAGPKPALELRIEGAAEALDRFEAAWIQIEEGGRLTPRRILALPDLPALLKALTPARWQLLERLAAEGPLSVYALAKRLQRDYKNVHTDVVRLGDLGLIERRGTTGVAVPWDAVRAELRLSA
jgi:predicted transcriptional regulator